MTTNLFSTKITLALQIFVLQGFRIMFSMRINLIASNQFYLPAHGIAIVISTFIFKVLQNTKKENHRFTQKLLFAINEHFVVFVVSNLPQLTIK